MNKEYEKLIHEIEDKKAEIERLNDECADVINEITAGSNSRILSYANQEAVNNVIEKNTKKIAKLIYELEDLEEVKRLVDEEE